MTLMQSSHIASVRWMCSRASSASKFARVDVEGAVVAVHRVHRLLQLGRVQEAELHVDVLDGRVVQRRRADLDHPVERVDQLVRLVGRAMDLRDGEERRRVGGIDVEDSLPAVEGVAVPLELVVPDAAEVGVHLDTEVVVVRDRHLALEDVHQVAPVLL